MENEEEARKYHLHINGNVGGNVVIESDLINSLNKLAMQPTPGADTPVKNGTSRKQPGGKSHEAENESDIFNSLLAWCDRGNILHALEGYLEQTEAPSASLLCIAGHAENNQKRLLVRITDELGEGKYGNSGKTVPMLAESSFDTVPAFARAICKALEIKNIGELSAKLAADSFDFQLLCRYCDCDAWQLEKIQHLLRTASAWLDGLNLASGPHRLVLVLVFRFSVGKTAAPWLDRLLRRTPLQRIQRAYAALAKPQGGLTARRIGELLVLDEFENGHILRWLDLPRVRLTLGEPLASELADYAIKNQFKGGYFELKELLEKFRKDRQ